MRLKRLLAKVFLDITRPEDIPASGKLYALNLIDEVSRKTWIYFLAKKEQLARLEALGKQDNFPPWNKLGKSHKYIKYLINII